MGIFLAVFKIFSLIINEKLEQIIITFLHCIRKIQFSNNIQTLVIFYTIKSMRCKTNIH